MPDSTNTGPNPKQPDGYLPPAHNSGTGNYPPPANLIDSGNYPPPANLTGSGNYPPPVHSTEPFLGSYPPLGNTKPNKNTNAKAKNKIILYLYILALVGAIIIIGLVGLLLVINNPKLTPTATALAINNNATDTVIVVTTTPPATSTPTPAPSPTSVVTATPTSSNTEVNTTNTPANGNITGGRLAFLKTYLGSKVLNVQDSIKNLYIKNLEDNNPTLTEVTVEFYRTSDKAAKIRQFIQDTAKSKGLIIQNIPESSPPALLVEDPNSTNVAIVLIVNSDQVAGITNEDIGGDTVYAIFTGKLSA
jgi:hypothetical protein